MISLPPYLLLIPYALFMLGFVFFALTNIISLGKYGARNAIGFLASFIFICGTSYILLLTWQSLASVDWTAAVPLFSIPVLAV
jgi:hypothetical protein